MPSSAQVATVPPSPEIYSFKTAMMSPLSEARADPVVSRLITRAITTLFIGCPFFLSADRKSLEVQPVTSLWRLGSITGTARLTRPSRLIGCRTAFGHLESLDASRNLHQRD